MINGIPMAENARAFQNGMLLAIQIRNAKLKVDNNHPNNTVLSFIIFILLVLD